MTLCQTTLSILVFVTLIVISSTECISNQECPHGYLCSKQSSVGTCTKIQGTISLRVDEGVSGPFLSEYETQESQKYVDKAEVIKEGFGHCGNERIPYLPKERFTRNSTSKFDPPCGSTNTCDYSSNRDTYTTSPNKIYRVIWMVFNCSSTGNWNNIAPSKIAEAHTLLNNIYSPVGYQFTYQINYYPCTGTSGTRNYATFDENLVVTAVTTEIGTNFQQLGRLVVVSGNPQISTLNGFFYFPGGSYSGIGFMNTLRVGTGFTTLPHELGHGFGLLHTFAGVSETNNCACPEVTASDNHGDFCSDTVPIAKNWECVATISTTTYPDPCTTRGSTWTNNPFTNLMSYGDCRASFTAQQQRRVRCYGTNSLTWLKDDRCFGKASNDPTVCNGKGTCTALDTCSCQPGWSGAQCTTQAITCFGKAPTDPTVCGGRGTCTAMDTCSCQSGWSGSQCTQFNCFGKLPSDPTVCNGKGTCTGANTCSCQSGWTGSQCTQFTCNGLLPTDPTVCNGRGTCTGANTCSCQSGWSGAQCTIFSCFGKLPSDPTVCSGKGTCTNINTCTCQSGWLGSICSYTQCFGKNSTDITVCNSKGSCNSPNVCSCITGWSGAQCTIFSCFGKLPSDQTVCSGKGTCTALDTCSCQAGFTGNQCQTNTIYNCFGKSASDPLVCSGKGSCTGNNICTCFSQNSGLECQFSTCFGKNSTDPTVCSGRGSCNSGSCSCQAGFSGDQCQTRFFTCFGINSTNPNVCSGKGNCTDLNTCQCSSGNVGSQCELTGSNTTVSCFGILSNNTQVCTKNGLCISENKCGCFTGFGGLKCEFPVCFGNYSNDACSGRGNCTSLNTCVCSQNVYGRYCDILECGGKNYTGISSCDQVMPTNPSNDTWYYYLIAAAIIPICCFACCFIGVLTFFICKKVRSKKSNKPSSIELETSLMQNDSLNSTYVQPEIIPKKVEPKVKVEEKKIPVVPMVEPKVNFPIKKEEKKLPVVPKEEPKVVEAPKLKPPMPKKREVYVAIYDFIGQENDELSFKVGDKIVLINKDQSGWWKGQCNGKTGLFPGDYVQFEK